MTPTRKYVREGPFFKISSQQKVLDRYAFLFNDLLVWVGKKRLGSKSYQVHQIIYLNRSIIKDIPEVPEEEKFSFEIIHSGDGRYVAAFADATQKKEWFDLVKELTSVFASVQQEEHKNELRFVDEENDEEEVPAALLKSRGHTAAPVMVLPPLTSMPKLTSKESRHLSNTVNSVPFPASNDPPVMDKSEMKIFTLPRNRKGSAPGALKPNPLAKSDENILQSIGAPAQIPPPPVKSPPVSLVIVGSVIPHSQSSPSLGEVDDGLDADLEEEQQLRGDPTDFNGACESGTLLKRQRSMSLNEINSPPAAPGVLKAKPTRGNPHNRGIQGPGPAGGGPDTQQPPFAPRSFSMAPPIARKPKPGEVPGYPAKPAPELNPALPQEQPPATIPTQTSVLAAAVAALVGSPPLPPSKSLKPKISMPLKKDGE